MKYVNYQKKITLADIENVEKELNIMFPEAFKEHYLQYNGGYPEYDTSIYNSILFTDKNGQQRTFLSFLPIKYRHEPLYLSRAEREFLFDSFQNDKKLEMNLEEATKNAWKKGRLSPDVIMLGLGSTSLCMHRKTHQILLCELYFAEESKYSSPEQFFKENTTLVAESFSEFLTMFTFDKIWISELLMRISLDNIYSIPTDEEGNSPNPRDYAPRVKKEMECTESAKKITVQDIEHVEKELDVQFPESLKKFYLQCNGGYPNNNFWFDPTWDFGYFEIQEFYPMCYLPSNATKVDIYGPSLYILELWAKRAWKEKRLPKCLVAFAEDPCGNYICLGRRNNKIYFFDHESDFDDESFPEDNPEKYEAAFVSSSFKKFLCELDFFSDDEEEFLQDREDEYF